MKKFILGVICVIVVLAIIIQTGFLKKYGISPFFSSESNSSEVAESDKFSYVEEGGVKYRVKAEGNNLYFFERGDWNKKFLKGVNIGAGEPGIFPGELSISYETYYRWFKYISEMNANCIRVYTTLRPQFYNALLDFNSKAENPIYLFQGVWMNEEDIQSLNDVYAQNNKISSEFIQDAKDVVDVLHGNITLPARAGYASGVYTADVSRYVAGIILGIEWDPKLVKNTNDSNPEKNQHDGRYLYTQTATPFETFLCNAGDSVIEYQTKEYGYQTSIAFTNWITTDPLAHPNEPHPDEDLITVNPENIKQRNDFLAGQFASYHVYPYYPDSMNYQKDYLEYRDEEGKVNTYRAYLKDLKLAHTMPIMISEFGTPTSRGLGHESVMGYNQGKVDETEQGKMILDMFNSMYMENMAGGIVFTWQDEWFKRTWNNVKFDLPDRRPYWSNIQTNEQSFGILSFDPGEVASACYVDGSKDDWNGSAPVITGAGGSLYIKSDERYVYFMAELYNFDFENDNLIIPIDIIANQGNFKMQNAGLSFDKAADYVISINGAESSRIIVDSYYDVFYYLYGEQYKMLNVIPNIRIKNTGRFNTMQMCYNYEMTVPPEGTIIPFKSFETGKLKFGNANPKSDEYKSLSDFYYKDGVLEIKIPWQLLNVMDPSTKKIIDDFYTVQSITDTGVDSFNIGMEILKPNLNKSVKIDLLGNYDWQEWTMPVYHERLKPSYEILKSGLLEFN